MPKRRYFDVLRASLGNCRRPSWKCTRSYIIAFPAGHRFAQMNAVPVSAVAGEDYLLRVNCEYKDYIGEVCRSTGFTTAKVHRSRREAWIQAMILSGVALSFISAFSPASAGL